jgi:uncharacterized surface protein with fasciclin (FAS1) repeats
MKAIQLPYFATGIMLVLTFSNCASPAEQKPTASATETPAATLGGQSAVKDDVSQKDVVKVAISSADHTTLVKAVQAADLVNVLSNAGPFTVFAPTNAAFDKLPAGTIADLLKPEKISDLQNILQYHVAVAVYKPDMLRDGMKLSMANGDDVLISVKDGKITLNGNVHVVATVPASNGIVHVVDGVLLPPAKK